MKDVLCSVGVIAAQMVKYIQLRRKLVREWSLPYVSCRVSLLSPRTSKYKFEGTAANVSATLRIIRTHENLNYSRISRLTYSPVANPGYIQCLEGSP